jgi:membrane protease YdiL (CAAX protease family)
MLAAMDLTPQDVHLGLLALGAVCAVALIGYGAATGTLRRPLAGAPPLPDGPPAMMIAVVIVIYAGLSLLLQPFAPTDAADAAPGSASWFRLMQLDLGAKAAVSLIMMAFLLGDRRVHWRLRPGHIARQTLAATVAILVFLPVGELLLWAAEWLYTRLAPDRPPPMHVVLEALQQNALGVRGVATLFIGAVVIAPLVEELFFRGVMLGAICKHAGDPWTAILVPAVLFGLLHAAQPQAIVPLTVLGVILGYLRLRTGALWTCVLAHALFNLRTMIFVLVAPELARG